MASVASLTGRPRLRLRMPTVSEHAEQVALMRWATLMERRFPELALLHAVPNGGARDVRTGFRLKREGVKRGVPDICLPVARGPWHGLYLELKRRDGGTLSEAQEWWLTHLQEQRYYAVVARGWEHAASLLVDYLEA